MKNRSSRKLRYEKRICECPIQCRRTTVAAGQNDVWGVLFDTFPTSVKSCALIKIKTQYQMHASMQNRNTGMGQATNVIGHANFFKSSNQPPSQPATSILHHRNQRYFKTPQRRKSVVNYKPQTRQDVQNCFFLYMGG